MTVKEYLKQVRELDQKINAKLEYIEVLETRIMKLTSTLKVDKVQESSNNQKEEVILKLIMVRIS